jgi:hypothetical protein
MAPTNEDASKASELQRFQTIPRQTLRAVTRAFDFVVFNEVVLDGNERNYVKKLNNGPFQPLLRDGNKTWPLTVQFGSEAWVMFNELISTAKTVLSKLKNKRQLLELYLTPLAKFYDAAEVDTEGFLVGHQVVVLMQTKGIRHYWKPLHVKGMRQKDKVSTHFDTLSIDDDADLESEFRALLEAAAWKSELYPHESARTSFWAQNRNNLLANGPGTVLKSGVVSIHLENDKNFGKISISENEEISVAEKDELQAEKEEDYDLVESATQISLAGMNSKPYLHTSSAKLVLDTEESTTELTPAQTRESSPAPTEVPIPT